MARDCVKRFITAFYQFINDPGHEPVLNELVESAKEMHSEYKDYIKKPS